MSRKIENFMKREVHQLPPTATVYEAARLMAERNCAAVVVSTSGRLEGIFTSGDLVKRVVGGKRNPAKTRLKDVMTPATRHGHAHVVRHRCTSHDAGRPLPPSAGHAR